MKTFRQLRNEAKQHDAYWIDRTVLSFLIQLSSQMKAGGLTKTQLAERIGTSKAYLSKIFSGNPNFTVATMVRLARAAGAQVEIRIVPAQTPATADGDDPVLGQFPGFLAHDIGNHPERVEAVGTGLVERIRSLVGEVDVDLDAALPADEE